MGYWLNKLFFERKNQITNERSVVRKMMTDLFLFKNTDQSGSGISELNK